MNTIMPQWPDLAATVAKHITQGNNINLPALKKMLASGPTSDLLANIDAILGAHESLQKAADIEQTIADGAVWKLASDREELVASAETTERQLADWNQVAFLFRSVKNDKVVALARFLEAEGVPVFSPRSNMFFERAEIRLMIGALIFLFPQFPKVRAWAEGVHLDIWDYYDQLCFKPFTDELRKPENKPLLDWARPLAKRHAVLTQNTDYAFSGLFYQLLQFPLFSRFLTEEAVQGVDKGRAARNLGTFSKLLTKFEYLHYVSVLNPEWLEKNLRDLFNHFLRFLSDSKDSDLVVVFGENAAAVLGLGIALIAITLAAITGDGSWDAIGSLFIGVVLIGVAIFLAVEVKSLIIGEAADPEIAKAVAQTVAEVPQITRALHVITIQQGPNEVLLVMKAGFTPGLSVEQVAHAINDFEDRLRGRCPEVHWSFIEPDVPRA